VLYPAGSLKGRPAPPAPGTVHTRPKTVIEHTAPSASPTVASPSSPRLSFTTQVTTSKQTSTSKPFAISPPVQLRNAPIQVKTQSTLVRTATVHDYHVPAQVRLSPPARPDPPTAPTSLILGKAVSLDESSRQSPKGTHAPPSRPLPTPRTAPPAEGDSSSSIPQPSVRRHTHDLVVTDSVLKPAERSHSSSIPGTSSSLSPQTSPKLARPTPPRRPPAPSNSVAQRGSQGDIASVGDTARSAAVDPPESRRVVPIPPPRPSVSKLTKLDESTNSSTPVVISRKSSQSLGYSSSLLTNLSWLHGKLTREVRLFSVNMCNTCTWQCSPCRTLRQCSAPT
jgi:hypothetical protein